MKTRLFFTSLVVVIALSALSNITKKKFYYAYNEKIYLVTEENKLIVTLLKDLINKVLPFFLKMYSPI